MKKKVIAFTLAASVLALSACNSNNESDETVVKSKAGNITKEELYQEMKNTAGAETLQMLVLEKVLNEKYKVDDKKVDEQLKNMKEQLGDNFDMYLAQEGMTEESAKKNIRLNMLQEAAITDGVEVTDEELEKRIDKNNTEINAQHVVVEDEETALKVKKKLDGGEKFADVAKEFSVEEVAPETGGDLGWFTSEGMSPEFFDAAYELEPKTISEPVKSDFGYHIIEVLDKRKVKEPKEYTDEEKEDLRKQMKLDKSDQQEVMKKISKLMKDADIKVEDKDLKSSLDMFLQNADEEQPAVEEEPAADAEPEADVETETEKEAK